MNMSLSKLWRWLRTGKPGVLQSMESQRVGHNWVTEQQQQQWKGFINVTIKENQSPVPESTIFPLKLLKICIDSGGIIKIILSKI